MFRNFLKYGFFAVLATLIFVSVALRYLDKTAYSYTREDLHKLLPQDATLIWYLNTSSSLFAQDWYKELEYKSGSKKLFDSFLVQLSDASLANIISQYIADSEYTLGFRNQNTNTFAILLKSPHLRSLESDFLIYKEIPESDVFVLTNSEDEYQKVVQKFFEKRKSITDIFRDKFSKSLLDNEIFVVDYKDISLYKKGENIVGDTLLSLLPQAGLLNTDKRSFRIHLSSDLFATALELSTSPATINTKRSFFPDADTLHVLPETSFLWVNSVNQSSLGAGESSQSLNRWLLSHYNIPLTNDVYNLFQKPFALAADDTGSFFFLAHNWEERDKALNLLARYTGMMKTEIESKTLQDGTKIQEIIPQERYQGTEQNYLGMDYFYIYNADQKLFWANINGYGALTNNEEWMKNSLKQWKNKSGMKDLPSAACLKDKKALETMKIETSYPKDGSFNSSGLELPLFLANVSTETDDTLLICIDNKDILTGLLTIWE